MNVRCHQSFRHLVVSVTHLDLECRRPGQPPPHYAAPTFRHRGTRKPSVPVHRPFSQRGFPSIPLLLDIWVSRPFEADDGATSFLAIELGCRRIPISPMVFPDPFLVPGGVPLSKHQFHIKVLSVHYMPHGLGQFASECLLGLGHTALCLLPLVPRVDGRVEARREGCRLNERPC